MSRGSFGERYGDGVPWQKHARWISLAVIAILAIFLAWNSFYTVAAHEKSVLLRFGRLYDPEGDKDAIQGPGLHFKIPLVDRAVNVETDEKSLALPYGAPGAGRGPEMQVTRAGRPEPLILTGDLYAGVVEWNVVWRVVDPAKFLFSIASEDVDRTIHAVALSAMNRVVGDYSADEILTGKREEIGVKAKEETQESLDGYDCGIRVVAVQMQRVTPPERVKPAFDAVNASIQQLEQLVNEARRERNQLIPQAEATRDGLIREAEGYSARKRAEADGEIAALLAKYEEYKQAPDITRRRLYLDAMEEIIAQSGPKTILDADLKSLLPLLDLGRDEDTTNREIPGSRR